MLLSGLGEEKGKGLNMTTSRCIECGHPVELSFEYPPLQDTRLATCSVLSNAYKLGAYSRQGTEGGPLWRRKWK